MKTRMDDPELLSPEIVLNMLISYRDVQVRDASYFVFITKNNSFNSKHMAMGVF